MKPFRHEQYSFVKVKLKSIPCFNSLCQEIDCNNINLFFTKYLSFFSTTSEKKYRTLTSNDRSTFDRRSFAQLQLNELNDRDTGKLINLLLHHLFALYSPLSQWYFYTNEILQMNYLYNFYVKIRYCNLAIHMCRKIHEFLDQILIKDIYKEWTFHFLDPLSTVEWSHSNAESLFQGYITHQYYR